MNFSGVLVALLFASAAVAAPTFSVELQAIGPNKIQVIKVVKDDTGLGLADSKNLVESAPKIVKANLEQAAANTLADKLRAAGATAAVVPSTPGAAAQAPATTSSVTLIATGPKKIDVIKIVREATGLGLAESKALVEKTPAMVKEGMAAAEADALVERLRKAGATANANAAAAGKVAAPVAPPPGTPAGPSTVTLTDCGPNKIQMIKIVREVTGLGLKEAKDLVEKTPSVVKKGLPPADAEALANKLQFAGGTAKVASDTP